jgi:lysophospholipase L1-like esterase
MAFRKSHLLLPILSVALFVIVAESALWLFDINPHPRGVEFSVNRAPDYPEVFLKDHDLFWRLRPNRTIASEFFEGKSYHINREGFRGDDFKTDKPGLRVAVLGNSCSFGWGVDENEAFAGRLQKILRRRPGLETAEVYNFSVPGYSSFQGKRNYKRYVRRYHPDIVLVTFGWNDQWMAANNRPDKMQEMPPQWILDIYNLIGRTRFYRLMKSVIFSVRGEWEQPVYRDQEARVELEDFKANLGEITEMAHADGARVFLMTSPIPSMEIYYHSTEQSYMHERHHYYNEMTREAAATYSAGLIDLAAVFDQYGNLFDDVSRDPFHYNKTGHALAANEISRILLENQ